MLFPINANREPAITSTAAGEAHGLAFLVTLLARLYEHCADLAYFTFHFGRVSLFTFLRRNENRPLIAAHALQVHYR